MTENMQRNLTEIYNSSLYQEMNGTTEHLHPSALEQNIISTYLTLHDYKVMCETTFTASRLAEIKPQILKTIIRDGESITFNCIIDWDEFISSSYANLNITLNGVVLKWQGSTIIKDIWHTVGLTEKLDDYGVAFFDALCDSILDETTTELEEQSLDMTLNQDGVLYNWLSNTVCIPYLDIEDGKVKCNFYLPEEFYKAFYNYIYDNYTTGGGIEYTLHPHTTTGDYEITTPVRLTKDLFRFAMLKLLQGNSTNPSVYDIFPLDADSVWDDAIKPMLDIYHYDTQYEYCNIMFKLENTWSSEDGYNRVGFVQLQFYDLTDNLINVSSVSGSGHTDSARSKTTQSVKIISFEIKYNQVVSTHQCGTNHVTYYKTVEYNGVHPSSTTNDVTALILTSAFFYGLGDSHTTNYIFYQGAWLNNDPLVRFGLCSCRLTEGSGVPQYFIKWKEPTTYTPRTPYSYEPVGTHPIDPDPTPEDEPDPTDPPVVKVNPVVIEIPKPIIKVIYPEYPVPPTPDPINIVGVPPVRTTPTEQYNGMVRTWYTGSDEMDTVNSVLWQDSVLDILTQMFRNSPLDCVLRFSELYAQPVEEINYTDVGNIVLGKVDCGDDSASNIISNRYIEMELGQTQIPRYFYDFRDYAPYTSMMIYLPFVQWTNLNINDFVGHDLKLTATVNIITGDLVYHVLSVDDNGERELYTLTGNCSNTLPMSANDRASIVSGIIGTLSSLAVGNVFGAIGGIANINEKTIGTGSITGNVGGMCNKVPYIVVTRPCTYDDVDMSKQVGDTTNVVCSLGAVTGYVRCKEIHIDSIVAPDEIKEYITELCKSGVHIK